MLIETISYQNAFLGHRLGEGVLHLKRKLLTILLLLVLALAAPLSAQTSVSQQAWDLAYVLAEKYLRTDYTWFYSDAIALSGGLKVYELTDDAKYLQLVVEWADRFYPHQIPTGHVDRNMPALIVLELCRLTGDPQYLRLAYRSVIDLVGGATTIMYHSRFWADDLYMVCPLVTLAGVLLEREHYLALVVNEFTAYTATLQKENGLFQHTQDSAFSWGRANGWVATAFVEVLKYMPQDYPGWATLLKLYQDYMLTILRYQDEGGMWHQLIDYPESYPETSSTAMFVYALAAGYNHGWAPEGFREAFREAALAGFAGLLARIDHHGQLTDVCIGTNVGYTLDYYLTRPTKAGDLHGVAPLMWACVEIAQLEGQH